MSGCTPHCFKCQCPVDSLDMILYTRGMRSMKIMVIDRDRQAVEEIETICENMADIELVVEPIKNNALETLRREKFDAVFFDPAPQNELRSFIIGARRGIAHYNPIIVSSRQLDVRDIRAQGANDSLSKPITVESFKKKLENAKNLNELIARLSDEKEDFPSREGVISKSAFYQIFISCLDRADRYGEVSFLTFARIENIDAIRRDHGDEVADEVNENLKRYTMRIRRLSDIAGRTASNEICLMLVRPANEDEPKLAFNRFSESMAEYCELISTKDAKAEIGVYMMELPTGEIAYKKIFR